MDSAFSNILHDTIINFVLKPTSLLKEEVVISATKPDANLSEKLIGTVKMDSKEIDKLPGLMGENDLLRAVQMSAGVQSVGEGFSSFYVRGGNYDQNLILLNNATIFNPSHLLGFYSVFNNDVINNLTLYKGLIPAKFGGRTSSVMNIELKDGNFEKYETTASVGILASKIAINGPIIKNKLSFNVAFRKTYINEIINPILKNVFSSNTAFFDNSYGFFDFNSIVSARLSHKDFIKFNYYLGQDKFELNKSKNAIKANMQWGNNAASAIWKHVFNESTFHEFSLSNSQYKFYIDAFQDNYSLKIKSHINESKLNYNIYKKLNKNNLYAGFEINFTKVLPGDKSIGFNNSEFTFNDNNYINSGNLAIYVSDNIKLFSKIDLEIGVRYNLNFFLGPYKYYISDNSNILTDSLQYSDFEIIKKNNSLSPRLAANYRINENTSLKAGISFNEQYLHVVEISALTLPADFWLPTTLNIKPQKSQIVSTGIFKNFFHNKLQTNIEGYYKKLNNLIEYNSGLISNYYERNVDENVISGKGYAWGIETEIEFKSEKFKSKISYTYSRSIRVFNDIFGGKPFYSKFDRPNDLSASIIYNLGKKLSFSAVFVYASGKLTTAPQSRYIIQGMVVNSYLEKNSFRMPDYHRLDISISYNSHKHKTYESIWELSVYNVYNRMNPFFIYYEISGDVYEYKQKVKAKQITLYPILPSISWKVKF
ncbi:MAG: hypothetical protein A2046_16420 [Bacteroidetes bacterium GWA2_30_7]|nr:MAG: hypothetical protein A2046_16420 [Bacteroidetes bacterium GWA2_30_7]